MIMWLWIFLGGGLWELPSLGSFMVYGLCLWGCAVLVYITGFVWFQVSMFVWEHFGAGQCGLGAVFWNIDYAWFFKTNIGTLHDRTKTLKDLI
jgi:hypothetical protein